MPIFIGTGGAAVGLRNHSENHRVLMVVSRMVEVWKTVDGFNGRYQVSDEGRVKVLWPEERILPQHIQNRGYPSVSLYDGEKSSPNLVHRLVAKAFVPGECDGLQVAHNDGDKRHNHATNLRWTTAKSNSQDRIKHGSQVCGERQRLAKLTAEVVRQIRASNDNNVELARRFGVSAKTIRNARFRRSWQHVA